MDIIKIMRLFVGSLDDSEVEKVIEDFRKARVKVELRHALYIDLKINYFIRGKATELKEKYKENFILKEIDKWNDYLEKAKSILRDGIAEKEFEEKFLDLVMPERKEFDDLRNQLKNKIKEEKVVILEDLFKDIEKEKIDKFGKQFMKEMKLVRNLHEILELNGIRYEDGKIYGKLPDESILKIYLDVRKDEAEKLGLESEIKARIDKKVDVYANLVDVIYEISRIRKLCEAKKEYYELLFMAELFAMIRDKMKNKMSIDELKEKIMFMEENGKEIKISPPAIEEILKTFEKAELIRIKKGKIVLK